MGKSGLNKNLLYKVIKRIEQMVSLDKEDFQLALGRLEQDPEFNCPAFIRFCLYFKRKWMERFPPSLWKNAQANAEDNGARTNNCLEPYNRRLGEMFLNAHPNRHRLFPLFETRKNIIKAW
jgi:hypothetical protein